MARLLLGGASEEQPLRTVGQRIAQAYDLPSVSVELSWVDSDSRRRALPLIVDGQSHRDRAGAGRHRRG